MIKELYFASKTANFRPSLELFPPGASRPESTGKAGKIWCPWATLDFRVMCPGWRAVGENWEGRAQYAENGFWRCYHSPEGGQVGAK